MVDNTFVEDLSNNGVDVLMIIDSIRASCYPWAYGM
jgi:hypothetical protein